MLTNEVLLISKYQQYVNNQKTKYRVVHAVYNAEKILYCTYRTARTLVVIQERSPWRITKEN